MIQKTIRLALLGLVSISAVGIGQQSSTFTNVGHKEVFPVNGPAQAPAISGSERPNYPLRPEEGTGDLKGKVFQALAGGDSIFTTGYDFQTNGTMPDRIINWGKNGIGPDFIRSTLIFMRATGLFGSTDDQRGAYGAINLQEDEESYVWIPIGLNGTYSRIESSRSGFIDVDYFRTGDLAGSVVFVSHDNADAGINIGIEIEPGSGQFFVATIPGTAGGLWPRVAIDGNNGMHVIYTFQDQTKNTQLMYVRSTDEGTSWGAPQQLAPSTIQVEGGTAQIPGTNGGDSYSIAANGSTVAVWYTATGRFNLWQFASSNGGSNWNISVPGDRPHTRFFHPQEAIDQNHSNDSVMFEVDGVFGPDTTAYFSDTVTSPGNYHDVLVLDDGTIIGVYNELKSYLRNFLAAGETYSVWRSQTSPRVPTIFFLSDQVQSGQAFHFVHTNVNGEILGESFTPTPVGLDPETPFLQQRGYTGDNLVRWPNLGLSDDGTIYMVFGSAVGGDTKAVKINDTLTTDFYLSHTYATKSQDGGLSWTRPQNLTPNGVDAQFATLADYVDDEAHVALVTDQNPGDLVTGDSLGLHPRVFSTVEAMIIPTSQFAISSVERDRAIVGSLSVNSPNPNPVSTTASLTYHIARTGNASIRVFDATGKEVLELLDGTRVAGDYSTSFDASKLASGMYHILLTSDGVTVSAPMTVTR